MVEREADRARRVCQHGRLFARRSLSGRWGKKAGSLGTGVAATQRLRGDLPYAGVRALAFSPDSKTLAVTTEGTGDTILWDMDEGRRRATLASDAPCSLSVSFSSDGRYLAVGGNGPVASFAVWNLATGECTLRINGGFGAIKSLAFSRDGTSIR